MSHPSRRRYGGSLAAPAASHWFSSNKQPSRLVGCALLLVALSGCGNNAFAPEAPVDGAPLAEYSLSVTPSKAALAAGQTTELKAASSSTEWISSAPHIARVDSMGVVTALSPGSVTITATEKVTGTGQGRGKKGKAEIVVSEPAPAPTPEPSPAPTSTSSAELPRVYVDTRYVAAVRTVSVPAGADLQAAINAAQRGDELVLAAGAIYTGNFVLPAKAGAGWITIRSGATLPAEGTRVTPTTAASFAKIVSPNSDPAIRTAANADYYRIAGVEMSAVASQTFSYGLVRIGSGETTDPAQQSDHVILDRVYVHGHSTLDVARCVELHGAHTAVVDSYLSQCHGKGRDTQAILGYNGTGPHKIVNNYLEGAGENIMFGGADTRIQNNVPSDIEIRGNHLFKPLFWKGVWSVKNLFELKNARRVLVEGNVMENNWKDAQNGFGVLFTPRNQDGSNPWAAVQDVTFRHNVVRNSENGINILGRDNNQPSELTSRIQIENNLFTHGWISVLMQGGAGIQIVHNTMLGTGHAVSFDVAQVTGFVYRDNLSHHGSYGIYGSGMGVGIPALNHYTPGYLVTNNLFFAGERFSASVYPPSTMYGTAVTDVGFVNFSGGDYRLSSTSVYRGKAGDGTDPGADFNALLSKTAAVVR